MQAKNTTFYPKRCTFLVDTNNLIHFQMIERIIEKFDNKTIERLNEVINGIKFYVGGNHWHVNEKGYIKYPAFEFNFNDGNLLIFLHKIFNLGFLRWRNMLYGALRRFIWESFCHEVIMSLVHIIKLNLNLAEIAKEYYLNDENEFTQKFISELFNYEENFPLRVNFIAINNSLWHESIPKLGFLDLLFRRKINQLKNTINSQKSNKFLKIKFFNELRKIKLNYDYEYNFSELINYCIHNNHFETLFRYNWEFYDKFRREFYYKAKRLILKFFKSYEINHKLKEYKDSANRTHYFLTHQTFERVKSACLQVCIAKLKNQILEEYEAFKNFYSMCPICQKENLNHINCEKFYFYAKFTFFKNVLLEKMNEVNNLEELNDDKYYFGIPCEDCFKIVRNIQGKFSDLDQIQKFILKYRTCPICGSKNHDNYLLEFYYDNSKIDLRNNLIQFMDSSRSMKNIKVNFGIPCCTCFTKIFGEVPEYNLNYFF